jgi:hypothetical protein
MGLKYAYTPKYGPQGVEYDPLVDVIFTNPTTGQSVEGRCLLDSGASSIILNDQFAALLGLDPERGIPHHFQGIARDPILAYDHSLTIQLKGDTHAYTVACSLMPGLKMAGLLGQKGFFEHYKVVFERYKQRIELTPIPAKPA